MSTATKNGLTLVLGPPNSGKRGLALEWWQERLPERPLIVMPTAPDAEEMSVEMAKRMGALVGQSPALTLPSLVRLMGRGVRLPLGEFERTVLVSKLLESPGWEALEGVADLPGLASAAGRLLRELGESGRSAGEVELLLQRWSEADSSAASLAHDVARLWTGYQLQLQRCAATDQATAVQQVLEAGAKWARPVALCGFTSFTRGQRALIEKMSLEAEVLLTLDHERELGVGLCSPGEAEWWMERAGESVDVHPRTRAYASAALTRLERHFLDAQSPAAGPSAQDEQLREGEGVRFLLSSGRRAEAEAVAEQIAQLIRAGFEPGGIAVVMRHARSWGRLLGDVFESCGIPYQTDERPRLVETGLGHAFLQAVRGVARDDAEALFSFLRSPYGGVSSDGVCDLEARYRQGVGRGAKTLATMADRHTIQALGPVWALIQPACDPADEADGGPDGAIARQRLDLDAAQALADSMLRSAAQGAIECSQEFDDDARAFDALQSALAAIQGLMVSVGPEAALRLLGQAEVSGQTLAGAGVVQIISAQRARARRFDAVFVIGLVEGEFPGPSETASLLSNRQRAGLDRLAGGLFPPEPAGERALFVGAASRAWRLLYLSAREAEDNGSEAVPSRFWTEAKSLLGTDEAGYQGRTLADQVFAADSAPSLRHYLRACAAEGRVSEGGSGVVPAWRRPAARLAAPVVLADLGSRESFSPSALESYARCPFAWFMERVVGLEELESELDGRVLGDLVHGVLRDCYRSLAADGLLPLKRETLPEAERRADALIEESVQGARCPGSPADRRVASHKLGKMARRLFQAEAAAGGSLVFKAAEVWVGDEEGVDVGGLRIRGRVDRIDAGPGEKDLFVFDYKSGGIPSVSAIGTEEGLQLPLYLLALGAEQGEAKVKGGAYVSMSGGELSGVLASGSEPLLGERPGKCRVLDQDAWRQMAEQVVAIARVSADGIRAGAIAPRTDRDCPGWCDLGSACRSRHGGYRP